MKPIPTLVFWSAMATVSGPGSPAAAADRDAPAKTLPTTTVNRHPVDLDGDGSPELEWVETIERSLFPNQPSGVDWSRQLTLVPGPGVAIRASAGTAEPFLAHWINPGNPQGDFPGDSTQWTSRPVFVSSVVSATFLPPPFGSPVTVVSGTIANRVPAREEPYHLLVRVGSETEARFGWLALRFRDLGGGFPEAGPGDLEVQLRGFGLGAAGEAPRLGDGDRFRPVRLERGTDGPRLVLDPLALRNGVESAPSLTSPHWTPVTSAETLDPTASARFFRFAR